MAEREHAGNKLLDKLGELDLYPQDYALVFEIAAPALIALIGERRVIAEAISAIEDGIDVPEEPAP